jgi:subtilase family serine protease
MSVSSFRKLVVSSVAFTLALGAVVMWTTASGASPHLNARPAIDTHVRTRNVCGLVTGHRVRCAAIQVLNPSAVTALALARPTRGRLPVTTTTRKATTTTKAPTTTASTSTSTSTSTTTSTTGVVSQSTCTAAHAGFTPCDLRSAYALPSTTSGAGQTVALVDAYNDPNAEADLGVYRAAYGIPACTTANGCFRKVNEHGTATAPPSNASWSEEIALDIDMVSAACPACKILLVEASSNSLTDLLTAENEAAALGATAISNSWDASEFSTEHNYDSYFNHNIPITASTGDAGYGVGWPASSPFVTAVGGTSLVRAANARGWTESAWSGAGSGCSAYEAKPAWQTDATCTRRTVADVSAIADPNTGVAVYDSYQTPGWMVFGGTSVSSPLLASVYALAGNGAGIASAQFAYTHASAATLNDVTSGSNGSCGGTYLCTSIAGYDGPTGLGTPIGTAAF